MLKLFSLSLHNTPYSRITEAAMFASAALIFYLFQCISENQIAIFSNWVVPDGITLHEAAKQLVSGALSIDDLGFGWGSYAFYYPSKWAGVAAYFIINLICLLVIGWRLGFGSIILFPYFLVAIALPSKDILVLLSMLFFVTYLVNGRLVLAFLVALLSYFFRDGAMFILMAIFVAYQIIHRNITSPVFLVAVAFTFGALFSVVLNDIFGDLGIVSRNMYAYEHASSELLGYGSSLDYFVRVVGNATNLAFRPSLTDENGGISILGVAYFISGISMLSSLIYSVNTIVSSKNKMAINLSVALLISLAVISLNPFVQGRYLFPFAVILLGYSIYAGNFRKILKIYLISIVITLLAMVAYQYSSIPGTPPNTIGYFTLFE